MTRRYSGVPMRFCRILMISVALSMRARYVSLKAGSVERGMVVAGSVKVVKVVRRWGSDEARDSMESLWVSVSMSVMVAVLGYSDEIFMIFVSRRIRPERRVMRRWIAVGRVAFAGLGDGENPPHSSSDF
ncbi:unnamed protein product [Periconia digitata]|uniref:Uncharacterized protein n=1 Tax=Periconia digitata TaxID=1303443 RepID=A0A9W4XKJ9_9PLEO|nr:unnamed protein product [Periconia digitata]